MVKIKNTLGSVLLAAAESVVIGIATTTKLLGQDKNAFAAGRLTDSLRYR